jgi:hypothetical protein
MIATHVLASGGGTNYTVVGILLAIFGTACNSATFRMAPPAPGQLTGRGRRRR